ncbi:MAG: FtsX-like permease family protein [Candidatus Brockarchaeota archaeon]|nr:FtsX-like permease family protein [Candidatus Brockarchaeota archaeon]
MLPDKIKTRVTGYADYWTVIRQIEKAFKEIGLIDLESFIIKNSNYRELATVDGFRFYFNVTSPLEKSTYVELLETGEKIKAFTLWPNIFQTSATGDEGIEGPVIFAPEGTLDSLSTGAKEANVTISGSIVVMNYSSEDNWKLAFNLGAKAVIFLEDQKINRIEDEKKLNNLPIRFTRVFVEKENVKSILRIRPGSRVKIFSKLDMENLRACDLIAVLPGSGNLQSEILTILAHVDSWSAVPAKSPGVDEGTGVIMLIELAKYFSEVYANSSEPRRTIFFVVTSGHWEGLSGARELSEFLLFHLLPSMKDYHFGMFVELSISSDSDSIGLNGLPYGTFSGFSSYSSTIYSQFFISLQKIYYDEVLKNLYGQDFVDSKVLPLDTVNFPVREPLDAEPFAYAGMLALTVYSAGSLRLHQRTIYDTMDFVNTKNLLTQMKAVFALIDVLSSRTMTELGVTAALNPTRYKESDPLVFGGWGSVVINGDIVYYDLLKGFYDKKDLKGKNLVIYLDIYNSINYLDARAHIIARIDPAENQNLTFSVVGLPINIASSYGPVLWYFTAFAINSTDGSTIYAPDLGDYGNSMLNFYGFTIWRGDYFKRIVVFKCGSAVLFDQLDPITFSSFYVDPNIIQATYAQSLSISLRLFNHMTHSEFTSYFVYQPTFSYSSLSMVFVPVGEAVASEPFEIIMERATSGRNLVISILSNSSSQNPEGYGHIVRKGEQLVIHNTGLRFAIDTFRLTSLRSNPLEKYNVVPYYVRSWLNATSVALSLSRSKYELSDYTAFYNNYINAWNIASMSYSETMNIMHDIINTSMFFSIGLIPVIFVLERLIGFSGYKRLAFLVGGYMIGSILMYFLHPGYAIASNIGVAIISFTVMLLAFPVFYVIISGTLNILKEFRTKIMGAHFSEISKEAVFMLSFSFGVENMRKRPLRLVLTLSTISLVTFSLVSLTAWNLSINPQPITTSYLHGKVPYEGILIRNSQQGQPISSGLYDFVLSRLQGSRYKLTVRSYLIPMALKPELKPSINIYNKNGSFYPIEGILGVTPDESNFFDFNDALTNGQWIRPGDYDVAIISKEAADSLNLRVGDHISYGGLDLKIVGILNSSKASAFYDLDGNLITPLTSFVEAGGTVTYENIAWSRTLIVPYKLSLTLGGRPFSISIISDERKLNEIIDDLTSFTEGKYSVYYGKGTNVDVFTLLKRLNLSGIEAFTFPLIIAIFAILNSMLGNVMERTKDISTLSSIGLSPLHIVSLFLSESIVYAILGSFMGYITGLVGIRLIMPFLPANMEPNYSSLSIILSVFFALLATISSSIYPFYKVSRMVTPSLERKWRLTTKPSGNKWNIPLPFEIAPFEVKGMIIFLKEFIEAHQTSLHPEFSVRSSIDMISSKEDDKEILGISFVVGLPPYDVGIVQNVEILAIKSTEKDTYSIIINLQRMEGPLIQWTKTNYFFVDAMRRQILLWRSLGQREKFNYIERGER